LGQSGAVVGSDSAENRIEDRVNETIDGEETETNVSQQDNNETAKYTTVVDDFNNITQCSNSNSILEVSQQDDRAVKSQDSFSKRSQEVLDAFQSKIHKTKSNLKTIFKYFFEKNRRR
jgi:hypothetical protein